MKNIVPRIMFFLILILSAAPFFVFSFTSIFHDRFMDCPPVSEQNINLKGYDFSDGGEIPLDGIWEFYDDKWIITDPLYRMDAKDDHVYVPASADKLTSIKAWREAGSICSYRLRLSGCPPDTELFAYIPRLNSSYRIFINGELVSGKGDMGITGRVYNEPSKKNIVFHNTTFYKQFNTMGGGDMDMVIEMASSHTDGLYMTPFLTEYPLFHKRDGVRQLFAAGITGVLIITIIMVGMNLWGKNKTLSSMALAVIDILILFRILVLNEYLAFLKNFIWIRDYLNHVLLLTFSLFLPIAFLVCVKQLLHIPIDKKLVKFTLIYELCFSPVIMWCAFYGLPHLLLLLCLASYLPFIFVILKFYSEIKKGTPYMLLVFAIMMWALSSMIVSNLNASGLLIKDESLFAPVCFMLSMLLQFSMYLKHNVYLQKRERERAELELKLKESEINLMLSQIKPHFLYNSLIAIHMLCTTEPETAAEIVLKFATFLRTNMNFINSRTPIPFEKEMEHIRNYVDIEKLRFQDRIEVVYDIGTTEFSIPPLSIQPLVENAVRHGACKNISGGRVWLEVSETERHHVIKIRDDGPGFDMALYEQGGPEMHGLHNVRFRLTEQMNADFSIDTAPGRGTSIVISLPKEDKRDI